MLKKQVAISKEQVALLSRLLQRGKVRRAVALVDTALANDMVVTMALGGLLQSDVQQGVALLSGIIAKKRQDAPYMTAVQSVLRDFVYAAYCQNSTALSALSTQLLAFYDQGVLSVKKKEFAAFLEFYLDYALNSLKFLYSDSFEQVDPEKDFVLALDREYEHFRQELTARFPVGYVFREKVAALNFFESELGRSIYFRERVAARNGAIAEALVRHL